MQQPPPDSDSAGAPPGTNYGQFVPMVFLAMFVFQVVSGVIERNEARDFRKDQRSEWKDAREKRAEMEMRGR